MTTVGRFLVDVYKYDNGHYHRYTEGESLIVKRGTDYFLQLNDKTNDKQLGEVLLSSDRVRFTKGYKNVELLLRFGNDTRVGLKFDRSSASSFAKFTEDIDNYINTRYGEIRYPSGALQYFGPIKNNVPYGKGGIEYYDDPKIEAPKAEGEFEDGKYDGVVTFRSKCGNIVLKANNVAGGELHDFAELTIGAKSYDIYCDQLNEKYNVDLEDDNLCRDLAKIYVDDLDEILFEYMTDSEKINYMFKEFIRLRQAVEEIRNELRPKKSGLSRFFG